MKTSYKKIVVECVGDDPAMQIYIGQDWVNAERIRNGEDDGVLCLCINNEAADTILEALNGGQA